MLAFALSTAVAGNAISKASVGYPAGGSGDPVCEAHMVVDASGEATDVLVSGCPRDFADRCIDAMSKWRWEPDGTTFLEHRTVSFKQSSPFARVGEPEVLVDPLIADRHHTALRPLERIPPKFPTAASGQSGKCKLRVVVPVEGGHPVFVGVDLCEEVFHRASRLAMYDWEFAPVEDVGDARWVRTYYGLVFEEPPAPTPLAPDAYAGILKLEDAPKPTFPTGGKKHSPATCRTELTVTATGRVRDVSVSECDPVFHVAAENAVTRWVYRHVGEPADVRVVEHLEFLSKRDQRAD
ncbi:MAG: hypothetical protein R3F61_14220 [Myxococcota bacterium]